jgi:hypothetical protein
MFVIQFWFFTLCFLLLVFWFIFQKVSVFFQFWCLLDLSPIVPCRFKVPVLDASRSSISMVSGNGPMNTFSWWWSNDLSEIVGTFSIERTQVCFLIFPTCFEFVLPSSPLVSSLFCHLLHSFRV